MLGKTLVTKQTGAKGKPCSTVMLAEKFQIKTEKYFAILMDRGSGGPIMIGSKTGGTSIEDIAAKDPSAIIKVPVDIMEGLSEVQAKAMAQEDAAEVEAKKFDLNYIKLDGSVACMVNGAGLAMSTMDLLSLCGGSPANFLDVGGGANKETICAAFTIIQEDPNVKSIFVNIFGGIMRCDVVAEGIVAAVKEIGLSKPLIVRLVGTNVELGKKIIDESGLNVIAISDFTDAAKKAVEMAK